METILEPPVGVDNEMVRHFLQLTSYGPSDILSLSYYTRTFLTRNGGRYRLEENRVIHLAGPDPDPSERL